MIYFYNIKETTEHTQKKYNQRDIIIVTENEKLKK